MLDSACKLMQELSVRVAVIVVSVSGVSGESGVSSAKLLTGSAVRQVFPPAPRNPIPRQPPITHIFRKPDKPTFCKHSTNQRWLTAEILPFPDRRGWLYGWVVGRSAVAAPTSWRFRGLQN